MVGILNNLNNAIVALSWNWNKDIGSQCLKCVLTTQPPLKTHTLQNAYIYCIYTVVLIADLNWQKSRVSCFKMRFCRPASNCHCSSIHILILTRFRMRWPTVRDVQTPTDAKRLPWRSTAHRETSNRTQAEEKLSLASTSGRLTRCVLHRLKGE